jgi:ATP-binding cassette subfamily B protein/subfamily B ATP-binding cassette protein MsbA
MGSERQQPGHSMRQLCLWALSYALRRRSALAVVLLTMLLEIGLDLLKPWPMKILVDHSLNGEPMPPGLAAAVALLPGAAGREGLLAWCVVGTVVLFLLAWGLGLAAAIANLQFGQGMVYDLATDLFGHLQRLSLRFHSRRSVGDTVRRVTADCGCVATIVQHALLPVLTALVTLVLMFGILCRMDALLALLALAVLPGMVFVFRRFAQPMMDRSYEQQEAEGRVYDVVEQTLSAIPVVQAFVREEHGDRRFAATARTTLNAALATTNVQLWFKVLMGLTTALGTAAILWMGGHHVLSGQLSVGDLLVFLAYLGFLYAPLETLMYTSSTVHGAAGSARRVLEVVETEPEVADRPAARPLPQVKGYVRLENVTFGYEPERPVLRDVSLEVLPGQTAALVGFTGAGKTTLVSLVPRCFDPWEGRITLDGHDVRDVQLRSLREQVGLVLQQPFLFPLTIAENIAYGRPGASRHEIEAAARAANAHAFIERLPEGYETVVGERGATLSGGERQRLSIARALLKDAPILILDEPTSALDAETEGLLLEALRRLMRGRTTLIIAHRLSTIRNADWIAVIDQGQVVEKGTHAELLERRGLYAYLHGIQSGLLSQAPPGDQRDAWDGAALEAGKEMIDG